jgi:aminopeptidase
MYDPRILTLARNLIHQSIGLQPGEKVLIENTGLELDMVTALVSEAQKAGGLPFVWIKDQAVNRAVIRGLGEEQARIWAENEAALMRQMDAYIGLRSGANAFEMSDVPADKTALYSKLVWNPVHGGVRVPSTKWVVLRYPTPSMAQNAGMSTEAFEDYYFDVCCLDYEKMGRAMDALVERMERTDRVHIKGPGTDLTFSIKGLPAIKCAGNANIPDGEVYTAPVRDSVNGTLRYNAPSPHDGFTYENVCLTFKDGKIIEATANDTKRINHVFDTDEGARYVGEFALGVNPYITFPMKDILFDEKISGSFHFTPGSCYDECDNGNKSAIHWDLVCIQRPEYGGGEIWFDGELIRKDGLFVPESLHCLNPDALK